ncbi:hypothetical protein MRX96_044830 [Rhipicephalus microplus]
MLVASPLLDLTTASPQPPTANRLRSERTHLYSRCRQGHLDVSLQLVHHSGDRRGCRLVPVAVTECVHRERAIEAAITDHTQRDGAFEVSIAQRVRGEAKGAVTQLLLIEQQAHLVAHHSLRS